MWRDAMLQAIVDDDQYNPRQLIFTSRLTWEFRYGQGPSGADKGRERLPSSKPRMALAIIIDEVRVTEKVESIDGTRSTIRN